MSSDLTTSRSTRPTARNPKTAARFRRESWWQITFPMLVLTLALLGGVVGLFLWKGEAGVSVVADFSLSLSLLLLLVGGPVIAAAVIGLIYLVMLAMRWIPPYAYIGHQKAFDIQSRVVIIANRVTGFLISVRAVLEGFLHFLRERGLISGGQPERTAADARRKS